MEKLKKYMNAIKSFVEALLGEDERKILAAFAVNGEILPGAGPTVQKIFFEANKPALLAAANKRIEDKKKKANS